MHILINYSFTFDQWKEASRAHRSPVRLRRRCSWRRKLAWVVAVPLILLFLIAITIRRDPAVAAGARAQYIFDPTIPITLIPQVLIGAFCYYAIVRRSTPAMRKAMIKPVLLMFLASVSFAIVSGYIARQSPPPPPPPPTAPSNPLETWFNLGGWFLLLLCIWFSLAWSVRNLAHAGWNSQPFLQQPHQATITAASLRVDSSGGIL